MVVKLNRRQRQVLAGIDYQGGQAIAHLGQGRVEPHPFELAPLQPGGLAGLVAQQQALPPCQPGGFGRGHQAEFKPPRSMVMLS